MGADGVAVEVGIAAVPDADGACDPPHPLPLLRVTMEDGVACGVAPVVAAAAGAGWVVPATRAVSSAAPVRLAAATPTRIAVR